MIAVDRGRAVPERRIAVETYNSIAVQVEAVGTEEGRGRLRDNRKIHYSNRGALPRRERQGASYCSLVGQE